MVMAKIEIKPTAFKPGAKSVWVELDCISDTELKEMKQMLRDELSSGKDVSDAFAHAFVSAISHCKKANPSDVWQHIVYRTALEIGFSDQQWKRISGFALERALTAIYNPRLEPLGLRMKVLSKVEAHSILASLGVRGEIKKDKIDAIIEKESKGRWQIKAGLHVKASLAERIQDDVPASLALMDRRILSIVLTMDSKSFPPPHGDGVNHGELGGRNWSEGDQKYRIKRQYIEEDGQFDALFSFNLRTPPSGAKTPSGKKIYTLGLYDKQPDQFVQFLAQKIK
jgi:hypothetical protein